MKEWVGPTNPLRLPSQTVATGGKELQLKSVSLRAPMVVGTPACFITRDSSILD